MKRLVFFLPLFFLFGCTSSSPTIDAPSPVLEAVEAEPEETPIETPVSAFLAKLEDRLATLGYEGVGLELETDATLELLFKVFSNPVVAGRKIQSVYTGAANDYDASNGSLTLGGTRNPKDMIAFIKKKVPTQSKALRNAAPKPKREG